MCSSLDLRPMTVIFGLGTGLHVHMYKNNGVLRNGQQPQSAVHE